jgi:DNA-binding NarL/FixJ family response regulator
MDMPFSKMVSTGHSGDERHMTPVRVGIVEDDDRLRADFVRLVDGSGDMHCVGAYASAEAALAELPSQAPDVVLMDINLPGMSGIESVRRLRALRPAAQVMMVTVFDDTSSVFESLKAGASGYVLKRTPVGELLAAIRDLAAGGAPMSGVIARKVVQYFGQHGPAPEVQTLTARERQVLVALSHGEQYKEIAGNLGISINTVRRHIMAIYDKLHVNSRLDAVGKLGRV